MTDFGRLDDGAAALTVTFRSSPMRAAELEDAGQRLV
jgi:hypothetical protein